MTPAHVLAASGLILGTLAITGCENKQHKLQRLQTEYAAAYQQYQIDCVDPMTGDAADALTFDPGTAAKESPAKRKLDSDEEKKRMEKYHAEDGKAGKIQQQIFDATSK